MHQDRLDPHPRPSRANSDTIFVVGPRQVPISRRPPALTTNDPDLPTRLRGHRHLDRGGIGLYGYYGSLDGNEHPPTTPLAYDGDAPPFFVFHGDQDTYTPAEGAERSSNISVRCRPTRSFTQSFPGAQHSFDLFHSVRFETVIDAIEAFAAWIRSSPRLPRTATLTCGP